MEEKRQRRSAGDRQRLAARMREAMEASGLDAATIAERMGVNRSAVDKWLRGYSEPVATNIDAYAAVVGKPVEWFFDGGQRLIERTLIELMLDVADMVLGAGRSGPAAIDRVLGTEAPLTIEERQRLAAATPDFRGAIRQLAGRDWDLLTESEKRAVMERWHDLARPQVEARRGPGETPAG